jgi:hypothetical protein
MFEDEDGPCPPAWSLAQCAAMDKRKLCAEGMEQLPRWPARSVNDTKERYYCQLWTCHTGLAALKPQPPRSDRKKSKLIQQRTNIIG